MAAGSTLSRRLSECLGVALFALALIWLIALVTYDPADPAWFFHAGASGVPGASSQRPPRARQLTRSTSAAYRGTWRGRSARPNHRPGMTVL